MNPYEILGVKKSATQDQIKSAYRKLAKKLHPDLNPGNKSVEDRFKQVNKAYEMIGTPEARAKYDRGETDENFWQQAAGAGGPWGPGGPGGPGGPRAGQQGPFTYFYQTQGEPGARYTQGIDPEMFESIFGGLGGMFGGRNAGGRGADAGAGAGAGHGRGAGSGNAGFEQRPQEQHYSMEIDFNTAALGGEREITLPDGKRLRVKIPGGVHSGNKLRLQGSAAGGGDVYIEVSVAPSPIFRRNGNDVETDLDVSLSEAVLGGEVRVPTVDGAVMLKIPAGVSTGSKIRIRGKGVVAGKTRGDQYANVRIVMPATIDSELKEAIRNWSQKHPYDPRQPGEGARAHETHL